LLWRSQLVPRFEDGEIVNAGASEAAAAPLPPRPEEDGLIDDRDGKDKDGEAKRDNNQSPPTAAWIASNIKAMINTLPPLSSAGASSPTAESPPAGGDGSTNPQSPAPLDSTLLKFLSTAAIMNGSISKGRQSVWSVLERLHGPPPISDVQKDGGPDEDANQDQSLMVYAPIIPTAKSKVEIAHSHTEFISADDVSRRIEGFSEEKVGMHEWSLPFGQGEKQKEESQGGSKTPPFDSTSSGGQGKVQKPKTPKVRKVTVWEPSTTSLSFQAMWWGYRL
jgi:hypothetical protein